MTEYIISERRSGSEESEGQKGPVGSGRVIGDILRNEERISEKRFLIDHSYVLFEKKLTEEGKVCELSEAVLSEPIKLNSFIRVTGRVAFNDMVSIKNTIANFNKIAKALAGTTNYGKLEQARAALAVEGNKESRREIERLIKALSDREALAKATGSLQDPNFLADLGVVLDYGFQDQLEAQIRTNEIIYSANLKRECLREKEDLLIRKYARKSEVEFTIFGIVTQLQNEASTDPAEVTPDSKMKEALMSLVEHLTNVEGTFTGRLKNEVIIDPIAVYSQIM